MAKITNAEALDAFIAEFDFDGEKSNTPPENKAWEKYQAGWRPRLNPTQQAAYDNKRAIYFLLDGERGTGKTEVALHMLVDHCFINMAALGFIIVKEVGQAKDGGAWDKLINWVLPTWRDGNQNPKTGEFYDKGIGLMFTQPRYDVETKKPYIWIQNRFGSGSMILCFSLPVGGHVSDKIRGREPSIALVDEATTCESDAYFVSISQQLGRRKNITTTQPLIFAANPDGPSHWLYKRFFEEPIDPDTGAWNEDYARYHVPIEENLHNLPEGYYDRVIEACRSNPILFKRMVRGEWIDMPTGQAIFRDVFSASMHIKGNEKEGTGLVPIKGFRVILGYDLGPAHSSIHFMQSINTGEKTVWIVFDEINLVQQYMPYREIVPKILGRMDYWDQRVGTKFVYVHISDNSAFNQLRTDGSFDVQELERLSGGRIQLVAAPKGTGSVAARMRTLAEMLAHGEILVSAQCPKTISMLTFMESSPPGREYDPDAALKPKPSDPHKHSADSLTYPIFYDRVKGMRYLGSSEPVSKVVYFA